jgi:hypothetical protein
MLVLENLQVEQLLKHQLWFDQGKDGITFS